MHTAGGSEAPLPVTSESTSVGDQQKDCAPAPAPVSINTMDEADAEDPFQEYFQVDEGEARMLPPEADLEAQEEQLQPAQQPDSQPPPPVDANAIDDMQRHSWWQRVGDVVREQDLKIGGAAIHPSHLVAAFCGAAHSIVFCASCGGTTQGAHSPLLADACRKSAKGTRQRQLNRMLLQHQWPTGEMQQHFGPGTLMQPIQFADAGDGSYSIGATATRQAALKSPTSGGCSDR